MKWIAIFFIIVFFIIVSISWVVSKIDEIKSLNNERNKLCWENNDLKKDIKKYQNELNSYNDEVKRITVKLDMHIEDNLKLTEQLDKRNNENDTLKNEIKEIKKENEILSNFTSNLTAFAYMSGVVADFETIGLERMAKSLDWGGNVQRAKKVADIRILRKETKELLSKYKMAEYQLTYLRQLFPEIDSIIETDYKQIPEKFKFSELTDNYDRTLDYLSRDEYDSLSVTERNQRALDNYINSHKKSSWQIGRDYEMYVGYKYSLKGYKIDYYGIENGLEDLGRDIIAKNDEKTLVIQCKYWSSVKIIREKHIAQLYGTLACYKHENSDSAEHTYGVFVTNIALSNQAKQFAEYLGIIVVENFELKDYPKIKCNIGKDEYGLPTKIYHLPFDQQYDSTKIQNDGEFYAFTVAEAESQGFRRAFKYHF